MMKAWLRHHWLSLVATASRLARQPVATLLNVATIGVALALPFGAYVVMDNARSLAHHAAGDPQMSVFLAMEATRADAERIGDALKGAAGVRSARFVPRDQAIAELKQVEGLADVVAALRTNPLPDAYAVQLVPGESAAAEALAARLREFPKVAQVQLDSAWVKRLDALLALGRTAVAVLATFLAVGLVAVTFNTVRLQIVTQAAEIEVSRLVGATDGYIRRPFYYLGGLLGALGGAVALLSVTAAVGALDGDVARLAATYGSDFRLGMPRWSDQLTVVGFAAVLGWMGAYLSVSRYLR
jgi:cell division transport system permease protein